MSGLATIVVGQRRAGKSFYSKKMLDCRPNGFPVMIYDINQEYKKYYKEPFIDFEIFLEKIVPLKYHYILIEEATIFFSTKSRYEEMINLLVRTSHIGNIIQLNFHSFRSVPKDMYDLLDYIVVFKTHDTLKNVKDKFDDKNIIAAYEEGVLSKDKHFYKVVRL